MLFKLKFVNACIVKITLFYNVTAFLCKNLQSVVNAFVMNVKKKP